MKLIGRYDSPFVRRVGVSLHALALPFELLPLSPFSQAADFRRFAPIGRMPVLVLDSGEALIESTAILDYLDEISGEARALLPRSGDARRYGLRIMASATAACEMGIAINYERRRPTEKVFDEWIAGRRSQLNAALQELEAQWVTGRPRNGRLMQPEITTACAFAYTKRVEPDAVPVGSYPTLERLSNECEATPAFRACPQI